MKTPYHSSHQARRFGAIATVAGLLLSGAPSAFAMNWEGTNGDGGDGVWGNANFSSAVSSSVNTFFDLTTTYWQPTATVTVGLGNFAAKSITVQNGKAVTLKLQDGAILTAGTGAISVGGHPSVALEASSSSLTIEGPASGSATLNARRFFLANNTHNVGTSQRNTLLVSGSNLTVNLTGGFNSAEGRAGITFAGGVNVSTSTPDGTTVANGAGSFYARTGKAGSVYDNYIRFEDASVSAAYIRVEGLVQLGKNAVLTTSAAATSTPLEIAVQAAGVNPGGRFEIEGGGLAADAVTTIYNKGTLAVGLSNVDTALRSGAASATLNSRVIFNTGSTLELSLFEGGGDKIILGETGWLDNQGTGATLLLKLDGSFIPEAGTTWSLFEIDPDNFTGITGNFDLSLIDTEQWDLSNFNQAGNWSVTSIPEPQTNALILLASAIGVAWRMKRRCSAA